MINSRSADSRSSSESHWFESLSRSKATRFRLFCFPYAGASADAYRIWKRWLPEQLDLCLVHLPGRSKNLRHPLFRRLMPLVAEIANNISHLTDVPYALFGHSMGALISFELCRELSRRQAAGPEHLFVSGRRAPQYPRDRPVIFNLPHEAFLSELKKLNGTPAEILENPELMEAFMDVLRADFELVETYEYHPGQQLSCPITVYSGLEDEGVPVESCYAWQKQTSATCRVRIFRGDHFFIRNAGLQFLDVFRADVLSALPGTPIEQR